MSIHPSLSSRATQKKERSVLSRAERLRILIDKDKWKEGNSVWGLPKIKTVRIKIKKEKAAPAPTTPAAETAAPLATEQASVTPKAKA
ncbi:MAG: small basic protein [Candidatus Omnitrophica bacterium]|nr:small basic protein [Candidatus Omnitrophota bacterium]